jgi:hypothetical protein
MGRRAKYANIAGLTYPTAPRQGAVTNPVPTPPAAAYVLTSFGSLPGAFNWQLPTSGGIPTPPAAGLVLTSFGTGPTDFAWEISGGFKINSFSGGTTIEIGDTRTNPPFTASYNETPDSANITNTDGVDSPLVLTTPFTSGTVIGTFGAGKNNGDTTTFTLHATKDGVTVIATTVQTYSNPIRYGVSNAPLATNVFIQSLASQQLHTASAGTYAFNVPAGSNAVFAVPTAYTFRVFDDNNLEVIPFVVGSAVDYQNPFTRHIPMTVYTVGSQGLGVVSFHIQP